MAKPSPVVKSQVCSECGLSWDAHTKGRKTAPTLEVCVRLLKAELAKPRPYYSTGTNVYGGGINLGGTGFSIAT